ncbi:MAG: peptidase domain-containing ABC transporter [Chitinophagales bacterium]|nr:peptidase domain-containing ABC transporter [Chitinophagales bacterium]
MKKFPFYKQLDQMDCGPSCLRMIAKFHGKSFSLQHLRKLSYIDRQGVSLHGISMAAENIGLRSKSYRLSFKDLLEIKMPCIAHWDQNHFVVIYKITDKKVWIADPGIGKVVYTVQEFNQHWISTRKEGNDLGIIMELEPSPSFYTQDEVEDKSGFKYLFNYLRQYKALIVQLAIGMLAGSIIQLIFPFLTQSIVDYGINNQDVSFIYLILIGQLLLFAGQMTVEIVRSWILLHIGARVNIALISDFLMKLLRLPLGFFDTKMIGDILQRINDHNRVEHFLSSSSLMAMFSVFNILVFGFVLFLYNKLIFAVFFISAILYFVWVIFFLKRRALIDHKRFKELSENRSHLIQLIHGVQDIKLNNSESQMRWSWEHIQARLFKVNIKALILETYQGIGAQIINQLKNIVIIFLAAKAVIDGDMTLGMMVAVQFIVGQLNAPIDQMIRFIRDAQDAKISLERIGEIHTKDNEEDLNEEKIEILPEKADINIDDLCFRYGSPKMPLTLNHINLKVPHGKTTAIVGTSGSGKTTLLKLLLKFYDPESGDIYLEKSNIKNIKNAAWRNKVGVVMQDGFIFSDTIAKNIAIGQDQIDVDKLIHAVEVANIKKHIESLPLGYNTKIGNEGIGLSAGQKQRILIARAVYKNPDYLFLDEATNALDANNEKAIVENLNKFLVGKTVIVVAHRLSTVKNADQIIVMDNGEIIERGTHAELSLKKGAYFELVKNQLELGS